MNILSIDTSTSLAGVALTSDEKVLAESTFMADRCLSARLVPEILRVLEIAGITINDIDLFACAIGPGSFTGVRAGVATMQGFALATDKPCAGFSSLSLLAMNFPLTSQPVCSLLDARKSEVYAALSDCSATIPTTLISDCVMPANHFLDLLCAKTDGSVIFCGEGAVRYQDVITSRLGNRASIAPFPLHAAHAANGALLALHQYKASQTVEPACLLPVYIRASEAEYAKLDRQKSRIKQ
ncbi:MAG: tRNA (adenosine(37)-N6)-threonylcarbamoyltransferase complex dimerization subunit type 1 TsaB [Desulfuromonadales bacterium]|nr:tRNA (adenosine(37)-N6)-threonylcarbamoyltransferase complex dimerization subunit type 1 TsaB [Desulfuromonadales bacterium]